MQQGELPAERIAGIGIDTIEIERIKGALEARSGARFERRVFTELEIEYCRSKADPYPHFAARFAAKESGMKALGTGWTAEVNWKGIEIWNNELGRPFLRFNGKTEQHAGKMGVTGAHVSLSHDRSRALAVVVLLGRKVPG
ncbi:MAG TPA: holo-ACP synthase [archaeon]|nr:holo-ACP synthase [archaeon]